MSEPGQYNQGAPAVDTSSAALSEPADSFHAALSPSPESRTRFQRTMVFFLVLGSIFSIIPLINCLTSTINNKDYSLWYVTGRKVLAGKPLYDEKLAGETQYTYPPTAAVLFYGPLSMLGETSFTICLSIISSFAWASSIWAGMILIAGRWSSRSVIVCLGPGLAVAPYVWDIQLLGQLNLLLLALVLWSFVAFRYQKIWLAGFLFGAAVSLKAFPLPALAYFIVRRDWKAVCASLLSIVFLVWFMPGVIRGFSRNQTELKEWVSITIGDQSGQTMGARSSIGFSRRNQSLISCSHRLLRHVDAGSGPPRPPLYVNMANVTPQTAQIVGYGGCLLLGAILLVSCKFHFAPTRLREGLEMAMVITLVSLCSPLAWTYFFCWLLPAWTCLFYCLNHPVLSPRLQRQAKIGAILAAILLASAVTEQIDPTLQAYGVTAWGSVVLFLTLALIRFQLEDGERISDSE